MLNQPAQPAAATPVPPGFGQPMGIQGPSQQSSMPMPAAPPATSVGGIMQMKSLALVQQEERAAAAQAQNTPIILNLAAHVRTCWSTARMAKEMQVEPRMFKAIRQRRGEYDPDVFAMIRKQGGSEIYMMLTSAKCRGAGAWLRDVMLANGTEKPWTLKPTPVPSLPSDMVAQLRQQATMELSTYMAVSGEMMNDTDLRKFLMDLREEYMNALYDQARFSVEQMEKKMEDQLVEGGFPRAMDQFIDDLTTFPAAILKGPVIRRKPKMQWKDGTMGPELIVEDALTPEWERVDPFHIYPSPNSSEINDGYLIERHRMRQVDLEALKGVEGYDEKTIDVVLTEYARGGLIEWLAVDSTKASAEGRPQAGQVNPEANIDAIQFWGSVPGKLLLEWGLDETEVPEPTKQYPCEVWLIGNYCIKASLNYHPLGEKPYFKACYEELPGMFWGNSVTDLVRDCQMVCNSTARALVNNMGISSGPQVAVLSDRLPPGENITEMYPWKIWQFNSDPMGNSSANKPLEFFQPDNNAQILMAVYEKFAILADEYSNIPRYMTGDAPAGGAGRTASGMNMLMNNASRSMKQVVGNIDQMMTKLLDRLFFHNMKYGDDPALQRTDSQIVARGAASVIAKEQAQIRRNEFLATTVNPIDFSIMGVEGRAALLRERAKDLDMDPDEIIPPKAKMTLTQKMAAAMQPPPGEQGAPAPGGGSPKSGAPNNGQTLENGAPITDHFSPTS